jgi:hypothetical protein
LRRCYSPPRWDIVGRSDGIDLATMIWLGLALAAPILLPACYRRKGWVEVAGKGTRA